jgi:hypothetical protein
MLERYVCHSEANTFKGEYDVAVVVVVVVAVVVVVVEVEY